MEGLWITAIVFQLCLDILGFFESFSEVFSNRKGTSLKDSLSITSNLLHAIQSFGLAHAKFTQDNGKTMSVPSVKNCPPPMAFPQKKNMSHDQQQGSHCVPA